MKVNLNTLANEITDAEQGKVNLTVAQVKDVIAALGHRWRDLPAPQAAAEFAAITERAGKSSAS